MDERTKQILREMLHCIAMSDHLGEVHEALDRGLDLLGLPPMPTNIDGTMSCRGWLDGANGLWEDHEQRVDGGSR